MSKIIHRFKSKSRKNVTHKVTRHDDGTHTCSCEGFIYGHHCWHTEGLKLAKREPRPEQSAPAKPRTSKPKATLFDAAEPAVRRRIRKYLKRHFRTMRQGRFTYRFTDPRVCGDVIDEVVTRFGVRIPRIDRHEFAVSNN